MCSVQRAMISSTAPDSFVGRSIRSIPTSALISGLVRRIKPFTAISMIWRSSKAIFSQGISCSGRTGNAPAADVGTKSTIQASTLDSAWSLKLQAPRAASSSEICGLRTTIRSTCSQDHTLNIMRPSGTRLAQIQLLKGYL